MVDVRNPLRNRQAQAGAFSLRPGRICPEEAVEDPRQQLLRDANTVVLNTQAPRFAISVQGQIDGAAIRCVLNRVVEKRPDKAAQARAVAPHLQVFDTMQLEAVTLGLSRDPRSEEHT